MALVNCPSCNKKMSSKAKECSHCGYGVEGVSHEDLARKKRLKHFLKMQKVQTQSFFALLVFVAGFYMMFFKSTPTENELLAGQGAVAIGFLWYIINRVRIVLLKKESEN